MALKKFMKICFVNDTFLIGRGVDTVIYELAKRLGKKHKVTVICARSNLKEENFRIRRIKAEKLYTGSIKDFFFPFNLLEFRRAISKEKFEIISLHHSTLFLGLIGMKNVIVTYHGSPPAYGITKYFRGLVNILGKISLRFTKQVITISNYLKEELIKFGVPKEKIVIIPNGVSEDFYPTWEDKKYMLYVGRLEKHKRVEELIKLAKEINFELRIVGDGPEKENLKSLAEKINAPVKILGNVDRKRLIKLYQKCSFFVSASKWEGFGLVFLEANACGKPVIGYNCCAIKERIIHGFNGFLAKNFEEFLKYCKILKENKKLRLEMGKNGLKLVKKYKWCGVVKKYESIFKISKS
jgi:phosphatidylinositol alpha-1,6-mannosyltransferase